MGKYASYTIKFKTSVASYAKGHTVSSASKEFGVDRKRVREWVKQFDAGRFADKKPSSKRLAGAGRKLANEQVDNELFEWFSERRAAGVRITGKQFLLEAQRRFAQSGIASFKGSRGWLQKWMQRHSVSVREKTTVAQCLPQHVGDKVTQFHRFVIRLRKLREYEIGQMGNMDETAVYFDMVSNSTLHHKGEKSVIIRTTGHEKDKLTVMLAAMADGRKLPPVVVLKGKREPPAADVPPGVLVRMSDNGWVNEIIIKWWLRQVWRREDSRKMLVWDAFRAHRTEDVKELVSRRGEFGANSDMVVIPGGCTGILQPADVSWNKPFKAFIQNQWDMWMLEGEHTFTPGGKMRKPTTKVVLGWVKASWENLDVSLIRKSFKKVGISNALDGTEDEVLWSEGDSDGESDEELEFPGFTPNDTDDAAAMLDNFRYDEEEQEQEGGDADEYNTDEN